MADNDRTTRTYSDKNDWDIILEGYGKALPEALKTMREIVVRHNEQHGQNWRQAVKAVTQWKAAQDSGIAKAKMDAVVEFTKLKLEKAPVDRDKLARLEAEVSGQLQGQKPDSPEFRRMMWQRYAETSGAAATDPATLGTLRVMQEKYPYESSFITARDGAAYNNYMGILKAAEEQESAEKQMEGLREQALGLVEKTGGDPDLLDSYINLYPVLTDSVAMNSIESFAQTRASAVPPLSTVEQETYDAAKKVLDNPPKPGEGLATAETERDQWARVIASPKFQWWAQQNGFEVGRVVPAEEGKSYGDGVKTPVGIYIPGPDDKEALKFANAQMTRRGDQEIWPWQHRRLGGNAATFGQVTVMRKGGPAPAEPVYTYKDGTVLDGPALDGKLQEARLAAAREALQAQYTKKGIKGSVPEDKVQQLAQDPLVMNADQDELLADVGVTKTAPQAQEPLTETLSGKFLAPRVGDPVGSVRLLGIHGEELFTPDQMTGEPQVTSGGGNRQTLAMFAERVRGRSAANREQRNREEGGPKPVAENAAATVVPTRAPASSRPEAVAARAEDASVEKRKREQAEAKQLNPKDEDKPYDPNSREAVLLRRKSTPEDKAAEISLKTSENEARAAILQAQLVNEKSKRAYDRTVAAGGPPDKQAVNTQRAKLVVPTKTKKPWEEAPGVWRSGQE